MVEKLRHHTGANGMGKFIKSSVVILALAIAGSAAMYAQAPGPGPRGGQWQGPRGPNPEMQTKMLTKRLNLSPQQAEFAKMHERKGRGPGGNWKPQGGSGAPTA